MEDDDVLSEVMLALAKGCNAEEWLLAFLSASGVCRRFHDCASLPHVWEAACAVRWCGHLKRREWMLAGAEDPGGWMAQYRRREAERIKEYPVFFMGGAMTLARPVGLHFFEPRYRRLIAIAMETDAKFVFAPEAPHAGQVAWLCECHNVVRYPDGRADLYVLPTARCHVRHARQERFDARYPSLHYAVAEVLPVQYSAAFTNLALDAEAQEGVIGSSARGRGGALLDGVRAKLEALARGMRASGEEEGEEGEEDEDYDHDDDDEEEAEEEEEEEGAEKEG
ncbi:hypothetical protein EMIHUDRAFT_359633 [Emiliania huxleyi CCMP1516]|uniref:Lon N-terminal domain-containing protein n=2 Tax=Emiliania huxleyi TaxID=2903 RepID=A0A0D3I4A1_EMIH1|nr:hypothetical protein EMIHUDRAFT_359633 [Emiliania huxleyi CCMP1516]EOD06086.1 hypothetical protein EMIHUDRAFT_359633 [Emiliania huxleyi CCMP1516]|eukprot:XP_005758515.1 hypothetical protein EMIHUDRAFT_359633 [Emiliania huxleyi CCMP1516]